MLDLMSVYERDLLDVYNCLSLIFTNEMIAWISKSITTTKNSVNTSKERRFEAFVFDALIQWLPFRGVHSLVKRCNHISLISSSESSSYAVCLFRSSTVLERWTSSIIGFFNAQRSCSGSFVYNSFAI